MPWSTKFDDPIPYPGGTIQTLEQAANYIQSLPKKVYNLPHWQLAMEQLIEAAEERHPVMFARIGFMKALNFGKQVAPRQKRAKKFRIVP